MSGSIKIGITMGDPNGIGPEVIVKSLHNIASSADLEFKPVIYGNGAVISRACGLTGVNPEYEVRECGDFSLDDLVPGTVSSSAGEASVSCIENAARDAVEGKVSAIVTAPISKESIKKSGSAYPGHTEMLRDLTGADHPVMMFDGGPFRVALVTIHVALSSVPSGITFDSVIKTIKICCRDLSEKFGIKHPKIAVCGLNPHAGESGAFGTEEIDIIAPAIEYARNEGADVSGPYPADTLFYRALKGEWDLVIAMYHDQGLIPFKMLAFDKGVNVTLGLPVIRTSPDHGTAFDIAWQGIADPTSMTEAIRLAVKLSGDKSKL